jgi:hypothetical protein
VLAAATTALTFWRTRVGIAFALAVPFLPLGNVALGLALLNAAVAAAWLLLHAREPERAPYVVLGALLGPFAGMLPFAYRDARSPLVRGAGAGGAVLLAAAVQSIRHAPIAYGIPESRDPVAVAQSLVHAIPPALALEALGLAVAAVLLPIALRRGRWGLAGWGGATLLVALLPVDPFALAVCVWLTVGSLMRRT